MAQDVTGKHLGEEEIAKMLRVLADARIAIELSAPHLPRNSEADLAAARALNGIYGLGGTLRPGGPPAADDAT